MDGFQRFVKNMGLLGGGGIGILGQMQIDRNKRMAVRKELEDLKNSEPAFKNFQAYNERRKKEIASIPEVIEELSEEDKARQDVTEWYKNNPPKDPSRLQFLIEKGTQMALDKRRKEQGKQESLYTNQEKLKGLSAAGLQELENIARKHGMTSLINTSGLRTKEDVEDIYEDRITDERFGAIADDMENLTDEQNNVIKEALTRMDSKTGELKYAKDNWGSFTKNLRDTGLDSKTVSEIKDKVKRIRKSFGGIQSSHFKGHKIDLAQKVPSALMKELKSKGYKLLPEEHGVLDIEFPEKFTKELDIEKEVMKNLDKQILEQEESIKHTEASRLLSKLRK